MSDAPEAPLADYQLYHADELAARIVGTIMLTTGETLDAKQFAAMSVEVAFAIINEVREYRLKDNKAVRRDQN